MWKHSNYRIALAASIGLYVLLLFGARQLHQLWQPQRLASVALNLSPMLGAAVIAWVIMKALWQMDELQRRIQLEAIAFSFLGTAFITFSWGFAEGPGLPHLSAFAVWPLMATLWVASLFVLQWRYKRENNFENYGRNRT